MQGILKKGTVAILCLILTASFSACEDKTNSPKEMVCNVDNPLTDLPWLRKIVENSSSHPGIFVSIVQCTYKDGIDGFLVEPCNNCFLYTVNLFSCDGTRLDFLDGIADIKAFTEKWNIENKKEIWTNYK